MWKNPIAKSAFRLNKGVAPKPYEIEMMKDSPPLQAADIAAFEMQKYAIGIHQQNYSSEIPTDVLRKSLISLGKSKHSGLIYRKEELKKSFAEIIQHNKGRISY